MTAAISFVFCLVCANGARAVTEQAFYAKSTKDLVDLCSASPNDPLYTAAMNFCEGFLVGAYQYHQLSAGAEGRRPLVCPPAQTGTRSQSISRFVDWANAHQEAMATQPVEGMFEFLSQEFPCRG
jgi:hypothetical protein